MLKFLCGAAVLVAVLHWTDLLAIPGDRRAALAGVLMEVQATCRGKVGVSITVGSDGDSVTTSCSDVRPREQAKEQTL